MEAMVAMNSIPQQEVAKGNGQSELARAIPTTSFRVVAKNPSPTTFWRLNYFMLELLIVLYFELENLNHEPTVDSNSMFIIISYSHSSAFF
jgi:hypothetical protein